MVKILSTFGLIFQSPPLVKGSTSLWVFCSASNLPAFKTERHCLLTLEFHFLDFWSFYSDQTKRGLPGIGGQLSPSGLILSYFLFETIPLITGWAVYEKI